MQGMNGWSHLWATGTGVGQCLLIREETLSKPLVCARIHPSLAESQSAAPSVPMLLCFILIPG